MNKIEFQRQLLEVMTEQKVALNRLLNILEEQHKYIIKNDVFGMEAVVEKIQEENQNVANLELKRRNLTNGLLEDKTLGRLVYELDNDDLLNAFRSVRKILEEIRLQKDTNELLIKQGISLNNRILAFLNPDRQAKTYNGYGKMKR
ncbi:flagellar biosynthesis protein FlgN [Clostridium novyi B str. ATCC 27606]|uniref:Flagellar biosynthesis protein FlgN n=2 Tax=Clostridium TaxID=1485 RepID=A0AA40M5G2_CLONO|nr:MULTISPECIES: flagellar protein FlgN [Clostridium]KEI13070.1 flagellar biosynthesis protein FlgN [Clostridium novyi B str. NCTC 9691]KEI15819.1 flagellar biosynthesis protein FlgN [Clostridium novyi B str. ATCC 27606]KEI16209.1 flagellar biosynthesis protein FlgN [Clostridium haemolyticum NCTC 9693]KGN03776.1 flagellar biosynthesis protein FlgN [Clostridium haemolyticum NCTC 8350]